MDLLGKKVLVAGCGKSGLGAAGLLQKAGAVPVLFDENEKLDGKALCAREDYPKDTALVLGSLPKELLSELSLAVLSPGISIEEAFVSTLEEADIPVWGEIELAWNYEKGKVLAITGTNGKTTTTTLVGQILKNYNPHTYVVGNIGMPYADVADGMEPDAMTAADTVLVPIQCEYYALEGLSQLMHTISLVQNRLNPDLEMEGVVFTMYDARTNLSLQVVENVKENLKQTVYKTIIPRNVRLAEAPSHGLPINYYDSKSAGAESYRLLAQEVIHRGDDNWEY